MERAMLIDKRLCPIYTSDQTKRKSGENPQRMHLLSHRGRAAEGPSSNPWQTKNTQCIKGTKGKDRVVPLELSGRLTQQSLAVANPWGLYNSLRRMPLSQTPKSLNFIFPTYVIPKSLKCSHWPSKTASHSTRDEISYHNSPNCTPKFLVGTKHMENKQTYTPPKLT